MLLLFFAHPPSGTPAIVNMAVVVGGLWEPLHSSSAGDAIFWTESELYQYIDEAAKRLGRTFQVFTSYDQSLTAANGTRDYTLDPRHVSTQQADLAGTVLRPFTAHELDSLSSTWPTDSGTPKRFLEDTSGVFTLTLHPIPGAGDTGKAIGLVENKIPIDISVSAAILQAPQVMREYFTFYALSKAHAKEGRAQMQETGAFFKSLVELMETTIADYWGGAN
jgi:hypothetical protein